MTFGDLCKHDIWLHMWMSEDNLEELALSFYHAGPGESSSDHDDWQKMPLPSGPSYQATQIFCSSKASCLFQMEVLKV